MIGRLFVVLRISAALVFPLSMAACSTKVSTASVTDMKVLTSAAGPILVSSGGVGIADGQIVTVSAATIPRTSTIVVTQANCGGPLSVSTSPAVAVTAVPATLPCVSGSVNAQVVLTVLSYGVSQISVVAAGESFAYSLSVVR
ncbi:MAG: hypothetical protein WCE44_10440 [Candidatus Velthaea sp.]|jgi:hypothetical protein